VLPAGLAYDSLTGTLYMSYSNFSSTAGGIDVFNAYTASCATAQVGSICSTAAALPVNNGAASLVAPYGIAINSPEPGTWFLIGGGLLVVPFLRRRQR
jgi:hypothetical protein